MGEREAKIFTREKIHSLNFFFFFFFHNIVLSFAEEDAFDEWRNSILERWDAKTRHFSQHATKRRLRALNQPLPQQIREIVQRNQFNRQNAARGSNNDEGEDDDGLVDTAHVVRGGGVKVLGRQLEANISAASDMVQNRGYKMDLEIYDDTNFYQSLLRQVIENSNVNVTDSLKLSRSWIEMRKLMPKKRKDVDRKASKGRKLRYTPHEKLINFMPPVLTEERTKMFDELIKGGLFGRKTSGNMKNSESEGEEEVVEEEEEENSSSSDDDDDDESDSES